MIMRANGRFHGGNNNGFALCNRYTVKSQCNCCLYGVIVCFCPLPLVFVVVSIVCRYFSLLLCVFFTGIGSGMISYQYELCSISIILRICYCHEYPVVNYKVGLRAIINMISLHSLSSYHHVTTNPRVCRYRFLSSFDIDLSGQLPGLQRTKTPTYNNNHVKCLRETYKPTNPPGKEKSTRTRTRTTK